MHVYLDIQEQKVDNILYFLPFYLKYPSSLLLERNIVYFYAPKLLDPIHYDHKLILLFYLLSIWTGGVSIIKHGQYEYPIAHQLIKDGKKNKVLSKKIKSKINVTMLHGQKDEVVPVSFSRKALKLFIQAKKKLVIIKNGDHSLSSKKNLKKIAKELNEIAEKISV